MVVVKKPATKKRKVWGWKANAVAVRLVRNIRWQELDLGLVPQTHGGSP